MHLSLRGYRMSENTQYIIIWLGVAACLSQSAIFSGLNLAVFGMTRLRLEVEASSGNEAAARVLKLRQDSHFLLTTILWGNVAVNTLLAILSNSVLTGAAAFAFSTVLITFVGEIIPQAYFARHALPVAARLTPFLRFYQFVLYPVAKPSAKILDWWLGSEGVVYFREKFLREIIKKHIEADEADVDHLEGVGALNFLAFDDLAVAHEGELIDPRSIISLPVKNNRPVFPAFERSADDPFINKVEVSERKWVIITDPGGEPLLVLDSDGFLRSALFDDGPCDPFEYCHRPIIVRDAATPLGEVVSRLRVEAESPADDVIDRDTILIWEDEKRIITGADILGRLMRGIVHRDPHGDQHGPEPE